MAAAEGGPNVVLLAERGDILDRNGIPAGRLHPGQDGRRRPDDDRRRGPAARPDPLQRPRHRLLPHPARAARTQGGQPLRVRRPPGAEHARRPTSVASVRGRLPGVATEDDPIRYYPADDVAANLLGFMGTDEPLGGFERTFDAQLAGKDGTARYTVGGGNRVPLGESSVGAGAQRHGAAHHHRPRPAVVHPAGARPDHPEVPRRERRRGRDGHPHRRAARAGRRPRPSTPTPRWRPTRRTSGPAPSATPTSPARWRRCSPLPRSSTPAR